MTKNPFPLAFDEEYPCQMKKKWHNEPYSRCVSVFSRGSKNQHFIYDSTKATLPLFLRKALIAALLLSTPASFAWNTRTIGLEIRNTDYGDITSPPIISASTSTASEAAVGINIINSSGNLMTVGAINAEIIATSSSDVAFGIYSNKFLGDDLEIGTISGTVRVSGAKGNTYGAVIGLMIDVDASSVGIYSVSTEDSSPFDIDWTSVNLYAVNTGAAGGNGASGIHLEGSNSIYSAIGGTIYAESSSGLNAQGIVVMNGAQLGSDTTELITGTVTAKGVNDVRGVVAMESGTISGIGASAVINAETSGSILSSYGIYARDAGTKVGYIGGIGGTINATATGAADMYGIYAGVEAAIGDLTGTATINVNANTGYAYGLYSDRGTVGDIAGTITAISATSISYGLQLANAAVGHLSGNVVATAGAGARGIHLTGGSIDGISGSVTANGATSAYGVWITATGGTLGAVSGSISATGGTSSYGIYTAQTTTDMSLSLAGNASISVTGASGAFGIYSAQTTGLLDLSLAGNTSISASTSSGSGIGIYSLQTTNLNITLSGNVSVSAVVGSGYGTAIQKTTAGGLTLTGITTGSEKISLYGNVSAGVHELAIKSGAFQAASARWTAATISLGDKTANSTTQVSLTDSTTFLNTTTLNLYAASTTDFSSIRVAEGMTLSLASLTNLNVDLGAGFNYSGTSLQLIAGAYSGYTAGAANLNIYNSAGTLLTGYTINTTNGLTIDFAMPTWGTDYYSMSGGGLWIYDSETGETGTEIGAPTNLAPWSPDLDGKKLGIGTADGSAPTTFTAMEGSTLTASEIVVFSGSTFNVEKGAIVNAVVSVEDGGTLAGCGTFGNDIMVSGGGTFKVGSSPGAAIVEGNVTLAAETAAIEFSINGFAANDGTTSGWMSPTYSQLTMTGTDGILSIADGAFFSITLGAGLDLGLLQETVFTLIIMANETIVLGGESFDLSDATELSVATAWLNDKVTLVFGDATDYEDFSNSAMLQFAYSAENGASLTLVSTYVPEPTTATLGVLGLAGLLLRRRRVNK